MKKEQFYPLGIFWLPCWEALSATWFHLLPASPDFPWGPSCQLSGNILPDLSGKGYLAHKGTSKGLVLALGTGFAEV